MNRFKINLIISGLLSLVAVSASALPHSGDCGYNSVCVYVITDGSMLNEARADLSFLKVADNTTYQDGDSTWIGGNNDYTNYFITSGDIYRENITDWHVSLDAVNGQFINGCTYQASGYNLQPGEHYMIVSEFGGGYTCRMVG